MSSATPVVVSDAVSTTSAAITKATRPSLQLREAIAARDEYLALRPSLPKKAALEDTELKDKLVKHEVEYKMTVDTLRIACANVEADLALELAPRLYRPREAKRVLANVFAAPGRVRVGKRTIRIDRLVRPLERSHQPALLVPRVGRDFVPRASESLVRASPST